MDFRNKEQALQYLTERKKEIMDDIVRERNEYKQQYQTVRSIPEVKALVKEVVRLMQEKYYGRIEFLRDHILLRNNSHNYDPTSVKLHYQSFNLNPPRHNLTGFIKFLCEETYRQTGNDLQLDIHSTFSGSYEVVVDKFKLNILDDDFGIPPSHNCSRAVKKRISGRNIISEIYNFRTRYCSIDSFECDSHRNKSDAFRRDCPDIAEFPEGFFRLACFYELTYIRRMSPYSLHEFHAYLFNATPNPNSKPAGGVDW